MQAVAAALILLATPALASEQIVGRASVTDGDTVVIRAIRIRLHGIDAPESAQLCRDSSDRDYRCGQRAALALADRIGEAPIACEPKDVDRYGRTVAVCRKGAEDLNAWMVEQGHAIAYRRYSADYIEAEGRAKATGRGIWAGAFQEPSEWRRAKRAALSGARAEEAQTKDSVTPAGCAIKGNINRRGDRIYHLPDGRDYAKVVINEAAGERMFCSEAEAQATGWRASRR